MSDKYERLTPKDLVETINMPQYGDNTRFLLYAQRLWDLENQMERGELTKLPCKLGQRIYATIDDKIIDTYFAAEINVCEDGRFIFETPTLFPKRLTFGKDVFLTKEEAEQRLKELEENK